MSWFPPYTLLFAQLIFLSLSVVVGSGWSQTSVRMAIGISHTCQNGHSPLCLQLLTNRIKTLKSLKSLLLIFHFIGALQTFSLMNTSLICQLFCDYLCTIDTLRQRPGLLSPLGSTLFTALRVPLTSLVLWLKSREILQEMAWDLNVIKREQVVISVNPP